MHRRPAGRARPGVALIFAALLVLVVPLPAARAQRGTVAIVVFERAGRLFPLEQFRVESRAGCPAGSGEDTAQPHLRTRSGGPATALDLTEVTDPDPAGCGFGVVRAGAPGTTGVRSAEVDAATLAAWTARTGISVPPPGGSAAPAPAPAPTPTERPAAPLPTGTPARPAATASPADPSARVLVVLLAAMVVALIGGSALAALLHRRRPVPSLELRYPTGRGALAEVDGAGEVPEAWMVDGAPRAARHVGMFDPAPGAGELVDPDASDDLDPEAPTIAELDEAANGSADGGPDGGDATRR